MEGLISPERGREDVVYFGNTYIYIYLKGQLRLNFHFFVGNLKKKTVCLSPHWANLFSNWSDQFTNWANLFSNWANQFTSLQDRAQWLRYICCSLKKKIRPYVRILEPKTDYLFLAISRSNFDILKTFRICPSIYIRRG